MMISAQLCTALDADSNGSLGSLVYIPEGEHTLTPLVDGKPKTIKLSLLPDEGVAIAHRLDQALKERLSANVRPFFDFDHKETGPASALPKRFYYVEGEGVRCEVEWTGSGKRAIESNDYSYFSPTFLLGQGNQIAGLPPSGAIGALVNEPAFRSMPRVAAKLSTDPNMTNPLVTCGLLTDEEAEQDNAVSLAQTKVKELIAQIKELAQKLEDSTKKSAELEVQKAMDAGKIACKDKESAAFWTDSIIAKGESAIKALNALPEHYAVQDPVIAAGAQQEFRRIEARMDAAESKARAELGASASYYQIFERAQHIDPLAYQSE